MTTKSLRLLGVVLVQVAMGYLNAQTVTGASSVTYDASSGQAEAYSSTSMDYLTAYYYNARVDANLTDYSSGGGGSIVQTTAATGIPDAEGSMTYTGSSGDSYLVQGAHSIIPTTQAYSCGVAYWNDVFDFVNMASGIEFGGPAPIGGGSPNSNSWTSPAYWEQDLVYDETITLGDTYAESAPTPTITSVSPSQLYQGQQVQITVTGTGFGSSPQLAISGGDFTISTPYVSSSNTQIVANVSVGSNTPIGSYNVSVTSQGYGGLGFSSGQNGTGSSGNSTVSVSGNPQTINLTRLNLMQVQSTGAPSGGTTVWSVSSITGTTNVGVGYAQGSSSTTNPNTLQETDPVNPCINGTPCPGGMAQVTATYSNQSNGQNSQDSFMAPTFGLSCYYTALQSDWGTAPSSCMSIRISGTTYSGATSNPSGLPGGSYCNSFLAEIKLQGSAVLNSGRDVQWAGTVGRNNTYRVVSAINGSDGTPVVANQTVARDKSYNQIIPNNGVLLDIDQVGNNLLANDSGQAIVGYRLDLYEGAGQGVCQNFTNRMSVTDCSASGASCPWNNTVQ